MEFMEEFRKIDLSVKSAPKITNRQTDAVVTMRRRRVHVPRKTIGVFLGVIALFLLGSFFTIVLPVRKTYSSAMKTQVQAKIVYDSLKKQNIEAASIELQKTKEDLTETRNNLNQLAFTKYIPIAGGYYNDADHLVNAGFAGLDSAMMVVDSLKPYADVLGLKGQGSFVMGSAEQRIQTAILTMGKITPRIDAIAVSMEKAQKEIDAVDPNHYPVFLGLGKIGTQLKTAQTYADEGVTFVSQARPLIKVLPSLLGESQEKKYLVVFQNDKELRPTGGFITAFAVFKIDKGIISVDKSEDIYALDASIPNKPKAPAPILKYLPNVSVLNLRDSNLSPDFIDSMETFRSLYDRASQKVPVDGIIAIDTHVLVSVIKILDDKVEAGGLTFTTQNDSHCDCPQVIYALEDNISRPVNYIKSDRKGLLGQLLYAIMQKALKSAPKQYWGPLFQNFVAQTSEKHVLFDVFNKEAQEGIEALNAAGRIKEFDGDYLHINEANFAGGKSNLFVTEAVEQSYVTQSDGSIEKTITIHYKNPFPPSDCNLERGGLCLNAPLRDWVRVYVPKGSQLVSNKGSQVKMSTYDELGKTVFEGFLTIRTQSTVVLEVKYKLPFKPTNGSLPLLIQKQPGTPGISSENGNAYTIQVNGQKAFEFPLTTDKEVKIKM